MTSFFVWEHGEEKLKGLAETFREIHPKIKCTTEWSQKSINVIVTFVSLIDGQIDIDLYIKVTDTNTFILRCATLCKKSIPYNEALRLTQICANKHFY